MKVCLQANRVEVQVPMATGQHARSAKEQAPSAPSDSALENSNAAEWEISPDELTLAAVLGEGEFGMVYKGKWNGTPVAIKVCSGSFTVEHVSLTH